MPKTDAEKTATYAAKQAENKLVQYKRWVHPSWKKHLNEDNEMWRKPYRQRHEFTKE